MVKATLVLHPSHGNDLQGAVGRIEGGPWPVASRRAECEASV